MEIKTRLRFGLRSLLAIVGVVCLLLSRYFPRIEVIATVDMQPKVTRAMEPTYLAMAKSKAVLGGVTDRHAQLFDDKAGLKWQDLRELYSAEVNDKGQVRIIATGKPKDRGKLDEITQAVASEYATFIRKSGGTAKVVDAAN